MRTVNDIENMALRRATTALGLPVVLIALFVINVIVGIQAFCGAFTKASMRDLEWADEALSFVIRGK